MSQILEDVATRVLSEQNAQLGNAQAAIDPAMVLLMIQIIAEIIQQIQKCRDESGGFDTVNNPSWVEKVLLRRQLVKELGRREFRQRGGNELVQSMLTVGADLTREDFAELWKEAV